MYLAKHRPSVVAFPLAADAPPPSFSTQVLTVFGIAVAGALIYGFSGAATPRLKPRPIRRPKRLRQASRR